MLACFSSNRPKRLKLALQAYAKQLEGHSLLVIDTDATHAENEGFLPKRALHYSETEIPELLPDYAFAFRGKYGGNRNQALAVAAARGEGVAFFDDDTLPLNDVMARHAAAIASGWKIVCGKYLGHAGGAQNLILQLISELSAEEPRVGRIREIFAGLPAQATGLIVGAGVNGGNLGISPEACRSYAFYPTSHRVEDGIYAAFADRYLGANSVYNPANSAEATAKLPVVRHEMAAGKPSTLREKIEDEVRGTSLGVCIDRLLRGRETPNAETVLPKRTAATQVSFNEYLLPYLQKNAAQNKLTEKLNALGAPDEAREFAALLSLTPEKLALPEKEYLAKVNLFFETQSAWKPAVAEAEAKLK